MYNSVVSINSVRFKKRVPILHKNKKINIITFIASVCCCFG